MFGLSVVGCRIRVAYDEAGGQDFGGLLIDSIAVCEFELL